MPGSNEVVRLLATISGRVQGVGFRYFASSRARSLGLSGWVRNEYDGSVRVVAEGSKDRLREFLDALRIGPVSARVDYVSESWEEASGEYRSFSVR